MKMKEKAWEIEFARKCQPLKPVCIGCCWASNGTEANRNVLMQYQAALFTSSPIIIKFDQQEITSNVKTTPKMDKPSCELCYRCVHICRFACICSSVHGMIGIIQKIFCKQFIYACSHDSSTSCEIIIPTINHLL